MSELGGGLLNIDERNSLFESKYLQNRSIRAILRSMTEDRNSSRSPNSYLAQDP